MSMRIYENGNYHVMLLDDGTKIRVNSADEYNFVPDFPESFDLKICDRCDMQCPMCHENSTPDGKLGDIMNMKFIETLHPHTEIAIGGGNPLEHPDLVPFLIKCKDLKLVPSITINQQHFMKNIEFIRELAGQNLIYGIGVSLTNPTDDFIKNIKLFKNAVIHIINGIVTESYLRKLKDHGLKILILGYKIFRRGAQLYDKDKIMIDSNKVMLQSLLPRMIQDNWFATISFDNLAVEQLELKKLLSTSDWSKFYLGNDGFATMYIDAVKGEFAKSSTSEVRYSMLDNIKDMFDIIRV